MTKQLVPFLALGTMGAWAPLCSVQADLIYEFSVDLSVEYYNPEEDNSSHLFTSTELVLDYSPAPKWSMVLELDHQPIESPDEGENWQFERLGLYASEAFIQYQGERHTLKLGKYEPLDDLFWQASTYFGNFNSRLSISESLTASWDVGLDESYNHRLAAFAFYADDSELAQSAFHKRFTREDYGSDLTETGELDSYALALYSRGQNLNYSVTYSHLENPEEDGPDSRVTTASLFSDLDWSEDSDIIWSLDLIHAQSDDPEEEYDTLTLGWQYQTGNWSGNWAFGYIPEGEEDIRHSKLFEFESSYDFNDNWSFEMALRRLWEEDGETTEAAMGLTFSFSNE